MGRNRLSASLAATIAMAGFAWGGSVTNPAPAGAYPTVPLMPPDYCAATGYRFPGGGIDIEYPGIGQTLFSTPPGTHVNVSAKTNYPNGSSMTGNVTGDITGRHIQLTVTRQNYSSLQLVGEVGSDNKGHGTYTYTGGSGDWSTNDELGCVPAPAAPPPVNNPSPAGTKSLGTATVVSDTDIYDKPDGKGQKIGTLFVGESHPLMEPCRDDWCRVGTIELGGFPGLPNGTAWVYSKGFLTFS
jgi:hypothetical protein